MTVFDVYAAKGDLSSGTYESVIDFGVAGQESYTAEVDVDELAATSIQVDWYTRETETDAWRLVRGVGSEAVETNPKVTFERSRYVKVVVTKTGTPNLPAGILGQ